ncbi:MAG: 1-deoxy-D-xylulose-5-phosphate reductoisomerase [Spirochaetia bacterium]|nr:1-deoxy-D-xylulose-5-phosphate reductoisomerase [Spirochaetia bacterium]
MMNYKTIILGITGSIGESALKVLRVNKEEFFLIGFSYHNNFELAKKIQKEFSVKNISCSNENITEDEIKYWRSIKCSFYISMENLLDIDYDMVLISVSGSSGIKAAYKAACKGKKMLLANKESLITAGIPIMAAARDNNTAVIPVDSEHNSVFRLLNGGKLKSQIDKIILTASGGPFFNKTFEEIKKASKKDVLNHPTWSMGSKITVDSAAMVNKALEIIEAHYLFNLDYDYLDAVIHPQSYIHAIVQHIDGSFFFHVNKPDMVYPLAHSFFYPQPPKKTIEAEVPQQFPDFTFHTIDKEKFPAFYLGIESGKRKGSYPAVYNAANEEAVYAFLKEQISFCEIPVIIEKIIEKNKFTENENSIDYLLEADLWARKNAGEIIRSVM